MLNGVGGATVAEAKERMTYAEALEWSEYLRKRGSANLGMRVEAGFALIAAAINNALGGKAVPSDFMPHYEQPAATAADVLRELTGKR